MKAIIAHPEMSGQLTVLGLKSYMPTGKYESKSVAFKIDLRDNEFVTVDRGPKYAQILGINGK